jgi:hypothetical protein
MTATNSTDVANLAVCPVFAPLESVLPTGRQSFEFMRTTDVEESEQMQISEDFWNWN